MGLCTLCQEACEDVLHEQCDIYLKHLVLFLRTKVGRRCLRTLRILLVRCLFETGNEYDMSTRVQETYEQHITCHNFQRALPNCVTVSSLNKHIHQSEQHFDYFKKIMTPWIVTQTSNYLS